jgi:hypothetical protein
MLLVCQLLLEMGDLRLETVYLLGLSIDSALLLVWGWLTINSLRAQCLFKQTDEGRRSFQISLIDLVSGRHQRPPAEASREKEAYSNRKWHSGVAKVAFLLIFTEGPE